MDNRQTDQIIYLRKGELSREHVTKYLCYNTSIVKIRKRTWTTDRRTDGFACTNQIVIDETEAATLGPEWKTIYFITLL